MFQPRAHQNLPTKPRLIPSNCSWWSKIELNRLLDFSFVCWLLVVLLLFSGPLLQFQIYSGTKRPFCLKLALVGIIPNQTHFSPQQRQIIARSDEKHKAALGSIPRRGCAVFFIWSSHQFFYLSRWKVNEFDPQTIRITRTPTCVVITHTIRTTQEDTVLLTIGQERWSMFGDRIRRFKGLPHRQWKTERMRKGCV